jgi:cytochrome c2
MIRTIALVAVALLVAACGTVAQPVYLIPTDAPEEAHNETVVQAPTATPLPPTVTPIPPTATPTLEPTLAPTVAPTVAPAIQDPYKIFVDLVQPAAGERLFNMDLTTGDGSVWQCATCHAIEPDVVKIGPSQWGLFERAGNEVEGQGPYTYVFNSIRHSQDHIVAGFETAAQMPQYPPDVLTDQQVYELIAYLFTLQ